MKIWTKQFCHIVQTDCRLFLRSVSASDRFGVIAIGVFILLLHVVPFSLSRKGNLHPGIRLEATLWWLGSAVMMTASIDNGIKMLYQRKDFDFLISSPVSSSMILASKLVSLATIAFLSIIMFAVPLIDVAALFFSPLYVVSFAVWVVLAVATSAVGLGIVLGFVRIFGVKHARAASQIFSAVLGLCILLAGQIPTAFADDRSRHILDEFAGSDLFLLPARAGRGDLISFFVIVALMTVAVAGAIICLGKELVSDRRSLDVGTDVPRISLFPIWNSKLFYGVLSKELRLICRDPYLVRPICGLLLAIGFSIFISSKLLGLGTGLLTSIIALIVQVVGSGVLAKSVLNNESSWDLIVASSCSQNAVLLAKLTAAAIIPFIVAVGLCTALTAEGYILLAALTFFLNLVWVVGPLNLLFSNNAFKGNCRGRMLDSNQRQTNILLAMYSSGANITYCILSGTAVFLVETRGGLEAGKSVIAIISAVSTICLAVSVFRCLKTKTPSFVE